MIWIYFSPHIDDAAFSCGGLIWQQAQARETVQMWTLCAGDPPPGPLSPFAETLHERWKVGRQAVAVRRTEDHASCARLSASPRHFPIPDCIYRRSDKGGEPLYPSEESLFGSLHPEEAALVATLSERLSTEVPTEAEVVSPLAIGNHVDHQLTRLVLERLDRPLWYYADYPYSGRGAEFLEGLAASGWQARTFPLQEEALKAWEEAIAAHSSQISTFWTDPVSLRSQLRRYSESMSGLRLWQPPNKGEFPKSGL